MLKLKKTITTCLEILYFTVLTHFSIIIRNYHSSLLLYCKEYYLIISSSYQLLGFKSFNINFSVDIISKISVLISINRKLSLPFYFSGEYVIVVQDVTNPTFLDSNLETAFLMVKYVAPKKVKKSTSATKKEKGPR